MCSYRRCGGPFARFGGGLEDPVSTEAATAAARVIERVVTIFYMGVGSNIYCEERMLLCKVDVCLFISVVGDDFFYLIRGGGGGNGVRRTLIKY